MQNQKNCYENVWILSGTSDGPILANKLLDLNYSVFASVVTLRASKSFLNNPKLHIITGKLNEKNQIKSFIRKNNIRFVVDATHPFAQIISKNLYKVCKEINTPLLVFERKSSVKKSRNFSYINGLKDIKKINLKNRNILLAIGSKLLNDTANHYLDKGANVFARVLPTCESVSIALGSRIKKSNIAILQPTKKKENLLERKMCEYWHIDYVLCRESGSYSQKNWERIISGSKMKLFLVKRPKSQYYNPNIFEDYDSLIEHIMRKF